MKRLKYRDSLSLRVGEKTRTALEQASAAAEISMAELARELLTEGLKARGLE
jgi:hypothetical protein